MNSLNSMFIAELDAAIEAHIAWTRKLLRCALTCSKPGEDVLAHDAEKLCSFGRWFTENRSEFDRVDAPAAKRLETAHRTMHGSVRDLCSAALKKEVCNEAKIDEFESSQDDFIILLQNFKTAFVMDAARHDRLTGLPLRHNIKADFSRLYKLAERSGEALYVAMIDLDRFKRINDTWGHSMGDLVLRHTAKTIRESMRENDMLYRYGGEEFLAFIRCPTDEDSRTVTERIVEAVRNIEPLPGLRTNDIEKVRVTVTVGVTRIRPNEWLDSAISRADAALYQGKQAGRDRFVFAESQTYQESLNERKG